MSEIIMAIAALCSIHSGTQGLYATTNTANTQTFCQKALAKCVLAEKGVFADRLLNCVAKQELIK